MNHIIEGPADIEADGIGKLYPRLLEMILQDGAEISPRNQKTKEIIGMRISSTDMRNNILYHPTRNLNYRFMVAEWCWIMAGREDLATIQRYNQHYTEFSDDGIVLAGAYGPRIRGQEQLGLTKVEFPDQLAWVVSQLHRAPDTRQAVVNFWQPPCPAPSKDIPCTLSFQFMIRQAKLEMIVTMRSSDAWLGIPYDFFTFSMIGIAVASKLAVEPGGIIMQLGSSHLYERDWDLAIELIGRYQESVTIRSPKLGGLPGKSLFDVILDNNYRIATPWQYYQDAIHKHTKQEALDVLRSIR
jgi:thymidylate synthase